jgi:hypothetical protein
MWCVAWTRASAADRGVRGKGVRKVSVECGECERDLRGGHDPSCSRYTPPARCPECEEFLTDGDGDLYCTKHGSPSFDAYEKAHSRLVSERNALRDKL